MIQGALGPYELLGELGRGGMGVVYRARHRDLRREVALKVPLERLDDQRRARFLREAQVAANLDHPGIVRVHEVLEVEGVPLLACELVEGARSVEGVWGPLAPVERARLLVEAARALGHAHAQGVVHRDVKPENLLVDGAGRVRVTDFGVAHARGLDRLTQTGQFLGTPFYAAPEQLLGEEVGPAADVWSLGVVLYQALTGSLPFPERDGRVLVAQILRHEPPAPQHVIPDVPAALGRACMRALRKEPGRRPADGAAFADLLEAALDPARPGRRARGLALGAGGLLLALAAGAALAARGGQRPTADPSPASSSASSSAPSPSQTVAPAPTETPAAAPDGPVRLALRGCGETVQLAWGDDRWLWAADEQRRVWLWRFDGAGEATQEQTWTLGDAASPGRAANLLALSGERAWALGRRGVYELRRGEPEPREVLAEAFGALARGATSADVLAVSGERLVLLDAEGRLEPRRYPGLPVSEADRQLDGVIHLEGTRYLVLLGQRDTPRRELERFGSLLRCDLGSGARERLIDLVDASGSVALDRPGGRLVYGTFGGRVTVVDTQRWQPIDHLATRDSPEPGPLTGFLPQTHPNRVTALVARGDRLYSACGAQIQLVRPGEVCAWSLLGVRIAQVGETLRGPRAGYRALALSPGGAWLAVSTSGGEVELWPRETWEQ